MLLTISISAVIGFLIGILVGRNNAAALTKARDQAQADLTAVKSQLAKLQAGADKVVEAVKKA